MKQIILLFAFLTVLNISTIEAQSSKQQIKERKELTKQTKKELNEKATKAARHQAKELKKQGWKVTPGSLPLEKQLDRSYLMQYEYDDEGYPKYIMAEAMSIGGNFDAAKMQALELAKQNVAGQLQTEVSALIESTVSNAQLSKDEAESITRTVTASKNLISQSLGRVIPVTEVFRDVNGNKEVLVRVAYSTEAAKKVAANVIRRQMEEQGQQLKTDLDTILGI